MQSLPSNPNYTLTTTDTAALSEVLKPSKADISRYRGAVQRLHKNLKTLDDTFKQVTADLTLIRDWRLYVIGGWATLKEFCERELFKNPIRVQQLLAAHAIMRELMEAGVPETELPENERLCRELRGIPVELRGKVCDIVQKKYRATGKKADRGDVQEAVQQLESESAKLDREQRETLKAYERAAKLLRTSLAVETLTSDFRSRIIVELTGIAKQVTTLIASLRSEALPEAVKEGTGHSEEAEDEAAE
jgi:hypothetical protein